jgi:hypothetical protein
MLLRRPTGLILIRINPLPLCDNFTFVLESCSCVKARVKSLIPL